MIAVIGMTSLLLVILIITTWRSYHVYRHTLTHGKGIAWKVFLSCFLVAFGQVVGYHTPHVWLGFTLPLGFLLSCFVIDEVLNAQHHCLPRDPFFIGFALFIGLQALMASVRGDAGILFLDEPFQPTAGNYVAHVFYFLTMMVLAARIAAIFFQAGKRSTDSAYQLRCFLGMGGYVLGTWNFGIALISLQILYMVGDQYRTFFTLVFNYGSVLVLFLVLLGIAPSACIKVLSLPLMHYKERLTARRQAYLAYLHQRITQLTPGVRLPVPASLQATRYSIEIGDARDLILSHHPPHPLNAAREAQYFANHLHRQDQITELGPFTPAPIRRDVNAYYVLVAQQLQDLESDAHVIQHPTTEP